MKLPLIIHRPLKRLKDIWRYKFKHKRTLDHNTDYLKMYGVGNNDDQVLNAFPQSQKTRFDVHRRW